MDIYPLYLAGEFRKSAATLDVRNPYNQELIAQTYLADQSQLETAIRQALAIQKQLRDMPAYARHDLLLQIADEITVRKQWFTQMLVRESAKPWKYAAAEIERSIQTFRIAAEESLRLPKEYISIDWTPAGAHKEGLVRYFPVGLVAGISPFNFPLNLAVHKIAPAIAAGCPIILKPSSLTPLSTLELARIFENTTLIKGSVSILPMSRETGNLMVTDPRIRLLSFTGSPDVGWMMKQQAGKKKVLLELGGNAGVIVTRSGQIEDAVAKCVSGAFSYSGQVCIHAQRIYVEQSVFDYFTRLFIDAVKTLRAGDPMDKQTDISVMIDEANARRVEEWIGEAVSAGARILAGGRRQGAYIEPTVLTNTGSGMKVCSMEIFGPVVTLESYATFEEAITKVNDSRFGLQAGVFTNNIDEMNQAFLELETGGVIINDVPTFRIDHMPYGGIKDSGSGREGVPYAMREMMEPRILVKNC
ncbi:MAG: aldehyde dehydrogenase family protein [Bacteroidales bacterium]|nr:aldehyde dehydrogenase family protein [Lentimicrobiaceae bacterium]MDD5694682.1 aldehyde dehydrogenase family protein [Bacteroidales bacterium]